MKEVKAVEVEQVEGAEVVNAATVAEVAPVISPNLKIIKDVKANFDISQFKKTGVVVATFQISAGNDVRYSFKAAGASMSESGDLVFVDDFTSDAFTDCAVYIPSLKKSVPVASDTVFYEVMAKAFYNAFKDSFAGEVKAKKEKANASNSKGD